MMDYNDKIKEIEDRIIRIEAALKKAGLMDPDSSEYTLDRACREAAKGNRKPLDAWCKALAEKRKA